MKQLSIVVGEWSASVAGMLAPICADDESGGVENIRRQVEGGAAQVFKVIAGAELVGYYVLRVDTVAAGKELVVIAGAGGLPGVPLLQVMLPAIEAQAVESGCRWVRIHTSRRGMYKQLPRLGYQPAEVVYRKEVQCSA